MPAYPARFNDGQSAAALPVTVRVEPEGLVLEAQGGGQAEFWAWAAVRLVDAATQGRPVRISNRERPGARLTFDGSEILSTLQSQSPYLQREPFSWRRAAPMAGLAGIGVAVVLFLVYGLPLIARPTAGFVPIEWEEDVGKQTVAIVNRIFAGGKKFCDGGGGVQALKKVTDRLLAAVETPYRVQVTVADSEIVNALATPGGQVVIFRGLIDKARTAEEVAGVLAHELAHVAHRHPTQGMITMMGWSALLAAFSGGASLSSEILAELAAHLATSAYSRDLEAEADAKAVEMLSAAGIDRGGLVSFFRAIQGMESTGLDVPEYLSSHPLTQNRIEAIEGIEGIEGIERGASGPAMSARDWRDLRKICG